jgi:hypothetical protein
VGIRSLLELDRCQEEEVRLRKERCAMQEWMMEEWTCVDATIKFCAGKPHDKCISLPTTIFSLDDSALIYQLKRYADHLCRLCITWQAKVRSIDVDMPQCWGPSEDDLHMALETERQGQWNRDDSMDADENEDEDEYEDSEVEDEEDGELFYASEVSALVDAYHQSSDKSLENLFLGSLIPSDILSISSPSRKRRHVDNYNL